MKNNKGFSMVELLAVVVIMGVLAAISIGAYSRYKEIAAADAYNTMSKSASQAAESYFLQNPADTEVTLDVLMKENFLASAKDPKNAGHICTGGVQKKAIARNQQVLSSNEFLVGIVCTNFQSCRSYPDGADLDWSQCSSFAE